MSEKAVDPKAVAWLAAQPESDLTDPDNPEWTETDFARARPAHEILPADVLAAFPKTRAPGRPRKAAPKQAVSLRLDPAVVEHFRAGGPGWQSRINATLAAAIRKRG